MHSECSLFTVDVQHCCVCSVLTFSTAAPVKADSHIACRVHAVPLPCPCRQGFRLRLSHSIYNAQPCLIHTCPCHVPTMPFFARPRHNTSVEKRPMGYLPAFGFFRLPRGVPRRLLPEAYQSQMQLASVKPNVCHGRGKVW